MPTYIPHNYYNNDNTVQYSLATCLTTYLTNIVHTVNDSTVQLIKMITYIHTPELLQYMALQYKLAKCLPTYPPTTTVQDSTVQLSNMLTYLTSN